MLVGCSWLCWTRLWTLRFPCKTRNSLISWDNISFSTSTLPTEFVVQQILTVLEIDRTPKCPSCICIQTIEALNNLLRSHHLALILRLIYSAIYVCIILYSLVCVDWGTVVILLSLRVLCRCDYASWLAMLHATVMRYGAISTPRFWRNVCAL